MSNAVGYARRIQDANCVENAQILYDCIEEILRQTIVVTVNCGMYSIKVTYSLNSIQLFSVDCTDGAMRLVGGSPQSVKAD